MAAPAAAPVLSIKTHAEETSPWLVGLVVVAFDIDVGQQLETEVPAGCLTAQERSDVAFHAFPVSGWAPCGPGELRSFFCWRLAWALMRLAPHANPGLHVMGAAHAQWHT
jgi:hypothetical protein